MTRALQILSKILFATLVIALSIIAYGVIRGQMIPSAGNGTEVDYTNFVVILLTTVTVIFSVSALALAVLGIIGFRSLKREAGKYASDQALRIINGEFVEGGRAHQQIENEFTKEDGHLKKWVARKIRQEVIALLPLIIGRLSPTSGNLGVDEDPPEDEGDVE